MTGDPRPPMWPRACWVTSEAEEGERDMFACWCAPVPHAGFAAALGEATAWIPGTGDRCAGGRRAPRAHRGAALRVDLLASWGEPVAWATPSELAARAGAGHRRVRAASIFPTSTRCSPGRFSVRCAPRC